MAFWPFRISVSLLLAWAREATDRTAVVYCLAHPEHVPDTAQQVQGPNWSGKSYKNLQQGMLHCYIVACQHVDANRSSIFPTENWVKWMETTLPPTALAKTWAWWRTSPTAAWEKRWKSKEKRETFLSTIALHWSYQQFVILYHMNHIVIKRIPSKSVISLWKNKDKHGKAGCHRDRTGKNGEWHWYDVQSIASFFFKAFRFAVSCAPSDLPYLVTHIRKETQKKSVATKSFMWCLAISFSAFPFAFLECKKY